LEQLKDTLLLGNNPYGVFQAETLSSLEGYYSAGAPSPWLGQGSCFMASESWTRLYEDHYLNWNRVATTPQGYQFRDGGEHVFFLVSGDSYTDWTSLGTQRNDQLGCQRWEWGAYSGGAIKVLDCPISRETACEDPTARDIVTIYKSTQLDIFGFSFKSLYLLLLVTAFNEIFFNAGDPSDISVTDDESAFAFGVAALSAFVFSPELPPVNDDVVAACETDDQVFGGLICDDICDVCDADVPSVCDNEFVSSNGFSLSSLNLGFPFTIIGDDRSVQCELLSDWVDICSTGGPAYCQP
jgi:hypothetical protein